MKTTHILFAAGVILIFVWYQKSKAAQTTITEGGVTTTSNGHGSSGTWLAMP